MLVVQKNAAAAAAPPNNEELLIIWAEYLEQIAKPPGFISRIINFRTLGRLTRRLTNLVNLAYTMYIEPGTAYIFASGKVTRFLVEVGRTRK